MHHIFAKSPRTHGTSGQVAAHCLDESAAYPRADYERYIALASESVQVGGAVETENWLQHADHYFLMMRDPPT